VNAPELVSTEWYHDDPAVRAAVMNYMLTPVNPFKNPIGWPWSPLAFKTLAEFRFLCAVRWGRDTADEIYIAIN
jgi:hypothetical protein